jgi:hypothetical protein
MPGPKSQPHGGKTRQDHASGKHARRLTNRHADPIREGGGKEDLTRTLMGVSRKK